MIKSDTISIEPFQEENGEIKMKIKFADVARYHMKVLLETSIPIKEWLQFIEDSMVQFEKPEHELTKGFFTTDFKKSVVNLIGDETHSFQVKKTQWKRFIEEQAEKLYLSGVLQM